jgi:CRISPR-associated exonuclease Cas4
LPGRQGLWRPFPVEYKRGRLRKEKAYLVQLCAQALCLEEALKVVIDAGAIYFGETRRRLDVTFDAALRAETERAAARLHALVRSGQTPPPVFGPKCKECSLNDLCQPRPLAGGTRASSYLDVALRQIRDEEDKKTNEEAAPR